MSPVETSLRTSLNCFSHTTSTCCGPDLGGKEADGDHLVMESGMRMSNLSCYSIGEEGDFTWTIASSSGSPTQGHQTGGVGPEEEAMKVIRGAALQQGQAECWGSLACRRLWRDLRGLPVPERVLKVKCFKLSAVGSINFGSH